MDPETGRIKLGWELVAGGTAGGCQVVCTDLALCGSANPSRSSQTPWKLCMPPESDPSVIANKVFVRKIRLQIQGEAAKLEGAAPKGAVHIVRQLGLVGLYRGASACLLRDIPFSAIYFPAYSHLKRDVFQEGYNGKQLNFFETLSSAAIA